jgi:hypothetical protein
MKLHQLKEFVKQTIREEQDYQQLFKHMLDKTGKSIPDMSDDDKKKFFNAVDKAYKAKSEGKLRGYNANINEYDEWGNTRIQAKNIFRMLKQKYNNNISKMKDGLELIFKQNKTKNDQAEVMRDEFNKFFKIREAELTAGQKKIDVDGDGEIEGSDLAALRAGKTNEENPGLWANIRAKRARGEEPAHKNSQAHKDAVKAGKEINKNEEVKKKR